VSLALACLPAAARADGFQRTLEVGANPVDVQLQYAGAAPGPTSSLTPGAMALSGEGSVGTRLPGDGRLTLRVPHVMGSVPTLGVAQVAASYDLAQEGRLLPKLAVVARVDLPTVRGTRGAHPGVRATAAKKVHAGVIDTVHVESELWTQGIDLTPSYRTLVGATFHVRAATSGSLDLVALRPGAGTGLAAESLAQLGLAQRLGFGATLRLGVAAGLVDGTNSLRATLGVDRRF
jgi:hypothetical protein